MPKNAWKWDGEKALRKAWESSWKKVSENRCTEGKPANRVPGTKVSDGGVAKKTSDSSNCVVAAAYATAMASASFSSDF